VAAQVLPVFPNFDLWTNRYTLVTFDTNPGRPSGQKRALLKVVFTYHIVERFGSLTLV